MYQRNHAATVVIKRGVIKMDRCCICHKYCYGHHNLAIPFAKGYCCDKCYKMYVLPAKIKDVEMREVKDGSE